MRKDLFQPILINKYMYFHGDRKIKEIAITFDDGPSEETLNVLDVLKKYDIKATFFIVGKMIKGKENIMEAIKKDGHEFGNHTFSHQRLWFKSKKFIQEDIKKCDDELQRVGIQTNLIRFPGLKHSFNAINICKLLNKKIIAVDFITLNQFAWDWFNPWLKKIGLIKNQIKIDDVIKVTIKNTRNGSILGFHDYLQEIGSHPELSLILENILPELKKKGFNFVTISDLLRLKRQIKFTALFVKNPSDLLKRFPPKHSKVFGHHSTIEFKPENFEELEIGKEQKIKVIGRAYDEFGDDLLVENPKSKNKYPHITLSRGENTPPLYSKILFEKAISSNTMEYFGNERIEVIEGYANENNQIILKNL